MRATLKWIAVMAGITALFAALAFVPILLAPGAAMF
jgi:hypothetical protein